MKVKIFIDNPFNVEAKINDFFKKTKDPSKLRIETISQSEFGPNLIVISIFYWTDDE